MTRVDEASRVLRDVFGFPEFRKGQVPVLERLLAGRSVLAVFPTGGGKSLCYQLPALMFDGLSVVVSPLIALMKDQVDFLSRRGIAAARLDSSLDAPEARRVYADLRSGKLKLLYVAPERLSGARFVEALAGRRIDLMAVDEAHCISEWGHNFRPEYLRLARLAETLQVGRVLALTATATPEVAQDIARSFGIATEDIVRTGFYRPNLELRATPCRADERRELLRERLEGRPPGPAIVYVTLQRTAEEVAGFLAARGFDAAAYHAGLKDDVRHQVQERFMASAAMIVVATIAFGMGIDKADIRAVYHYNLPKGPEGYAQEIGRAGRDGEPAYCELFACADDTVTLENFAYGDTPAPEAIGSLLEDLLGRGPAFDLSVYDVSGSYDIRPLVVETLLTYLELEGVLEPTGPFYAEFKVQPQRPLAQLIARFDARRAAFLQSLFDRAKRGSKWLTIDVPAVAESLREPRGRILKALNYLEEQGEIVLQASGVRQGYRRVKADLDTGRLHRTLITRFQEREAREVARVHRMLELAQAEGCLTRRLLAYFGEDRDRDCGHCGPCLGEAPAPLPTAPVRTLGRSERQRIESLLAEAHPALASPRQVARFLCGLSSPATIRARLTKHQAYGTLAELPFAQVLTFIEGIARQHSSRASARPTPRPQIR